MLSDRSLVLGVTGSIAAYKGAELASRLTQEGARVDVVLTAAARRFVTSLTFRGLTGRPAYSDMFEPAGEVGELHVALARRADAVLVAPASATTLARLAHGLAEDLLSLTVLATRAPVLLAPAMDNQMYESAATQSNLETLRARGCTVVEPAYGRLASGQVGRGRLAELEDIVGALKALLGHRGDLAGRRLVVSAGGTHEPIDPVRFVGNASSGKMGFALAEAARDRGAEVVLVTGPTALRPPYGVTVVPVRTAEEMLRAVQAHCAEADALVMAAAVADFRPGQVAPHKIKRGELPFLTLELVPTPDILAQVGAEVVKVGFAAESQDLAANAARKLEEKGLDLIVANDITAPDSGFGSDTNRVMLIDRTEAPEELPLLPKYQVAHRVLDRVVALLEARGKGR